MESKPTSTTSELLFWRTNVLKFQLKQQISLLTECLTYLFGIVVQFYYCKCAYPKFSNDNRVRLGKSAPFKKSDLKAHLDFPEVPYNQNDNILIDKTGYSSMINMRSYRGGDVNAYCLVITKKVENWFSEFHNS